MPGAMIEQPWSRLGWIIPSAIILWAALLTVFGLLLERTAPPPEMAPAQVQIVEVPAPAGLQGGPAAAPAAPKPISPPVETQPVKPHPHPRIERPVVPHPVHHMVRPRPVPEVAPAENGTAKSSEETAPAASAPAAAAGTGLAGGAPAGTGSGSGSGAGSDSGGARAVYAPTPEIPDDLRDQIISTVAVAHFKVDYDGQVQVTLTTPTDNPRLNEILLDTLKEWKFFPAMHNGVAIGSEFDVRIPVSVE
jgi:periplasmic protein TonB